MGARSFFARWRSPTRAGLLATLVAAAAAPACADSLSVTAKGTIQSSCGVTLKSNFGAGNFAAAGQSAAEATVSCNTGFAIKVNSQKGAVQTTTAPPPGFVNTLPYNIALSLPLDQGGTLSGTCAASAMTTAQTSCPMATGDGLVSSGKTASGRIATLTASWTTPAAQPVSGSYSDVITVSVALKS